ncbi:MAG TPA: four helix bundle protein [Tepidiformaceae bacterium]|nr:four helix bundle protein [Tepidiformaceae bacterium]
MRPFQELVVWQRAHQLVLDVYRESNALPAEERFGLTSQMRRSAASVPANIAEGSARNTDAEMRHFLSIAFGSATELEYHLLLAKDLAYISPATHSHLDTRLAEVKRMLNAFIHRLQRDPNERPAAKG